MGSEMCIRDSDSTPRAGNDSGGGQPGRILKCKGWEKDPNAYTYFITQAAVWEKVCDVIGKPEWKEDENYSTPAKRLPRLNEIFDTIESWTMTKTKFEVMDICNPLDIPVGPILSLKELANSFRDNIGPTGISKGLHISITSNLVLVIVHDSIVSNISFNLGSLLAGVE